MNLLPRALECIKTRGEEERGEIVAAGFREMSEIERIGSMWCLFYFLIRTSFVLASNFSSFSIIRGQSHLSDGAVTVHCRFSFPSFWTFKFCFHMLCGCERVECVIDFCFVNESKGAKCEGSQHDTAQDNT
jgi:hypothetical protein